MLLLEERKQIVFYGNQLIKRCLTTGSGGNISIYNRKEDLIALTPSSMNYSDLTPEDILVIDPGGNIVEGTNSISTEINMHLLVYRNRLDVCGIVHTHSLYATAMSCMGWDIEPVHYMLAMAGPVVKCSKYAIYGSEELGRRALDALGNRGACLLGNHGLLAAAATLEHAFSTAEHLEYVAKLTCVTKNLGNPNILTEQQIQDVMDKFGTCSYK
ncbi:MAG: class II aldolase/adducin family protein [Oscillospiraceae bacterium]|nr:class II aldolase/adducin family protein [Oscillospiraceae bacterium]